jgi:L-2-hydroxyglutarate oxidase
VLYDFAIVGGGIVGLSTGVNLMNQYPKAKILILEKEDNWAKHQTGHNSGVIHSGIYYKPDSFKARFAKDGNQSMIRFCQKNGIEHDICGKVIVATKEIELSRLESLYKRGVANGLNISKLNREELNEIEPHVAGLAAIKVPTAGIVNYKQVCLTFVSMLKQNDHDLLLNTKVQNLLEAQDEVIIETSNGIYKSRFLINCSGLHSDRITRFIERNKDMKIVPFRGEYYKLKEHKRYLVKHLVYPVPDPQFPFLGVHFTRMIGGDVEAGPNAVLSFKREGYRKNDFDMKDFIEVMSFPGFWKLGMRHWRAGIEEVKRSFSKKSFVKSLQELIPEIEEDDLEVAPSGVRAQALMRDGTLVDDFHFVQSKNFIHVCNAPSPAATASIQIGKAIAEKVSQHHIHSQII